MPPDAETRSEASLRPDEHGLGLLRRVWSHLAPRRKLEVVALVVLTLGGTFLETLSLGAVLPFITVLVDPQTVFRHRLLAGFVESFGIESPAELAGPLTAAFIGITLLTGAARLGLIWATHHASFVIGADMGNDVFRRTLYQPFSVHVAQNSSALIAGITKKVSQTTHVFQVLLIASTSTVLALGIITALLLIDPVIATLAALVFGGSYLAVARFSRKRLLLNSHRVKKYSTALVKLLQESLGGIRDVLLDGTQETHSATYRNVDRPYRSGLASNGFLATGPRTVIEAFGISGIAILAFVMTQREGGVGSFLPVLGALAMGAQRLLPAFQQIYVGYAHFAGHQASILELVELLERPLPAYAFEPPPPALKFEREIRFENVSFRYEGHQALVLEGVDLVIQKGERVGFVGKTGGGKSTALDLLMGLLEPTSGRILVDGEPIVGTHGRSWQRAIAHVPQSIFLADTTVGENIAFGIAKNQIDLERVRTAARIAHIAEFVEAQPAGYDATIGERGVRLSGGQRQRMGIARALYKRAEVLVFDEATSALDNATERDLMEALGALSRDLTVLMIAHRLSTVERCDKIVVVDQGRVAAVGSYAELLATNDVFQSLAAPH